MKRWAKAVILCLGSIALDAEAGDVTPDLFDAVQGAKPGDTVAVIVRLRDRATPERQPGESLKAFRQRLVEELKTKADLTQAGLKAFLLAGKGARIRQLWSDNSLAARVPAEFVGRLAGRPEVDLVMLDRVVKAPAKPLPLGSLHSEHWNLATIGVGPLWARGVTGQNAVVASLDTGVDIGHADLRDKWRGLDQPNPSASWFDPWDGSSQPNDLSGHGTQTLGLIAGGSVDKPIGAAPGAKWIAAKIFDNAGQTDYSTISLAFGWLLNPDGNADTTDDIPDIVNASIGFIGTGFCDDTLDDDIALLRAAGIFPVFAAGNDGQGPGIPSSTSPADNSNAFSVGAVDELGEVDFASSRGPSACNGGLFPHVSAPGVNVRTTDLTFGGFIPDATAWVTGTSFSAPHVAGALALLKSATPTATIGYLQAALERTARDIGDPGPDFDSGYGIVDAGKAHAWLAANNGKPLLDDMDADGYAFGIDCNDSAAAVHPDAAEIKYDGIDQDCNGYDLTITIVKAVYKEKVGEKLVVEATSALGKAANLRVRGLGRMNWVSNRQIWRLVANDLSDPPSVVRVKGIEGWAKARVRTPRLN
jgi:serine protease AprX